MVTIDSVLTDIMELDFESRQMLLRILQKRQIENRREEIAKAAEQTLKEYRSGKLIAQSVEEIIEHLNSLW